MSDAKIIDIGDYALRRRGACWVVGPSWCLVCNARQVSIAPSDADLAHLECARCGRMAVTR